MPPEVLKYIEDINTCIERISFHMRGVKTFSEFANSWTVYDAVERRLAIIGEALWKVDKLDKNLPVTNKRRIIGLRHILTHDYDLISPEILWKILEKDLPLLKTEIQNLQNS